MTDNITFDVGFTEWPNSWDAAANDADTANNTSAPISSPHHADSDETWFYNSTYDSAYNISDNTLFGDASEFGPLDKMAEPQAVSASVVAETVQVKQEPEVPNFSFSIAEMAALLSDRGGSSESSDPDEIVTPKVTGWIAPGQTSSTCGTSVTTTPAFEDFSLKFDSLDTVQSPPPARDTSTIQGLLHLTEMINTQRGFYNIREHRWLPLNDDINLPVPGHRPIWTVPQEARDVSLFVAILRPGSTGPGGLPTVAAETLRQSKSKKKKSNLKAWDPLEVAYPLGYIPFTEWIHMSDMRPGHAYSFDVEAFRSAPCTDGQLSPERQEDPDMAYNKYDSFYNRKSPETDQRECYCGCCRSWHKRDQCNWLHHMKSAHGIRSCTKQRYALPHIIAERPDKKEDSGMYIGYCDKCQSWQNVNNSTGPNNNYASWFLHQASHDVERNKIEGRSGKKRSKKEMKQLQWTIRDEECEYRNNTKRAVSMIIADDYRLNGDIGQFTAPFFARPGNYAITTESQDIDGGY